MSAPSESATSPSPCACTNISLMQLFHELKQKFPGVPDHVVSNTIELYCHDKQACETHLHKEVKASLTHAYHASSSAAARQLNELKLNPPGKCRNQPIIKHEITRSTPVKSISCQGPQTAVLSSPVLANDVEKKLNTDANQNVVEHTSNQVKESNDIASPVTVINIDKCAKYNVESPSDIELTNESPKESLSAPQENDFDPSESINYKIHKSNKIRSNLNERLQVPREKAKRPNTLDFIKPNPDIAFKQTLREPEPEVSRTVSPVPPKHESQPKDNNTSASYRTERGYPVNLSVNVNCHMDLSRYDDLWLEDYDSPRAITSVNLTVCTPTSNMASPVRETQENDGGFGGHVTVTVSPSTTRPTRRKAPPPPPPSQSSRINSPRPSRVAPEPPGSTTQDRSLIERQKERRDRLAKALEQEKRRLAQLTRETAILAAPPPPPSAAQALRDYVQHLRNQCDMLSKKLEMRSSEADDTGNFYNNIYTGQRPSSYWQCHMCTFRNFPLLNRCEECDMPRIYVGTSDAAHDSGLGSLQALQREVQDLEVPHRSVMPYPKLLM
ncbi:uncharacterized protein LOC113516167 isoform X1 [Galleria mellonella]|uniref:Uncharacterized protein LOC113516167 isoform X1 n=1 Tax=Galleria mellonella TaxID=7137 RepID=A0ABM3MUX4_GALME|nr:uncharacterized protein LOC113516167 isoform X1 [Galleria mellonella]